jgi:hypothetical protein
VYKPSKTHVVVDALSRLSESTESIGVLNQTIDTSLFYTRPKWLNDVKELWKTRNIKGTLLV